MRSCITAAAALQVVESLPSIVKTVKNLATGHKTAGEEVTSEAELDVTHHGETKDTSTDGGKSVAKHMATGEPTV